MKKKKKKKKTKKSLWVEFIIVAPTQYAAGAKFSGFVKLH